MTDLIPTAAPAGTTLGQALDLLDQLVGELETDYAALSQKLEPLSVPKLAAEVSPEPLDPHSALVTRLRNIGRSVLALDLSVRTDTARLEL